MPNYSNPSVCEIPENVNTNPLKHHGDSRAFNKNDESWKAGMIFFLILPTESTSAVTVFKHISNWFPLTM